MEGSSRLHVAGTPDTYPSAPVEMLTGHLTEADLNAFDGALELVSRSGFEPSAQSMAEILVGWPEDVIAVLLSRRGL